MTDNPKHIQAQKEGKIPFEYLVLSVLEGDAHIHKGGADKYGERNWRIDEIKTSTYEGAIMRHFKAWAEGEDIDPESGWSHLYHIRACCAIILDAQMHDTLIDDRGRQETKEPPAMRLGDRLNGPDLTIRPFVCDHPDDAEGPWDIRFTQVNAASQIVGQETRGPYQTISAAKLDALANPWNLPGNISIHKSPLTVRNENVS